MKTTYKSLYPSIDLENNIAPNTQIGKIEIDEKVYEYENRYVDDKYSRGGEFIENLVCDNIIVFANRWLHLANFSEVLDDLKEFYMLNGAYDIGYSYLINSYVYQDGRYVTSPFMAITNDRVIQPFVNINGNFNPLRIYGDRPQ